MSVASSVDQYVRLQLNERLLELETAFNADVLSMSGPLAGPLDEHIRTAVEARRMTEPSRGKLVVFLTTSGGIIETVQRIVETLRHHYSHVSFVIPNYAFSAGTVLSMSGDDIYMDYFSRLGPIDPQIQRPGGQWVPALGYLAQWNRLLKKADEGTLRSVELQLMITAFDQAELYMIEQARDLSVSLLTEWLVKYKFKDWEVTNTNKVSVTQVMKEQRAQRIGLALNNTERWHTHGHGISMQILQDEIGLQINNLADNPGLHEQVKQYDALLSGFHQTHGVVALLHTAERFEFPFR